MTESDFNNVFTAVRRLCLDSGRDWLQFVIWECSPENLTECIDWWLTNTGSPHPAVQITDDQQPKFVTVEDECRHRIRSLDGYPGNDVFGHVGGHVWQFEWWRSDDIDAYAIRMRGDGLAFFDSLNERERFRLVLDYAFALRVVSAGKVVAITPWHDRIGDLAGDWSDSIMLHPRVELGDL